MPYRMLLSFCCLILFSHSSLAASVDINLHSDALRISFTKAMERKLVGDFGALFLDERSGNKHSNKSDGSEVALHAGLHIVNDNLRFGIRSFYISPGDTDLLAVGFGGQANINLSRSIGVGGHFYYAPEATSFMDGQGYRELALRLNLRLNNGANLYLGYRNIDIEIEGRKGELELDDDIHIGLKMYF